MTPRPRREYLGITRGLASYQRAYRIPDGIEIDNMEGYEVQRRRVFFEDVLLITYHRALGALYLTVIALLIVLTASIGILIGTEISVGAALFTLPVLVPLVVALVLRIAMKVDVITVWGRRSRAEIRFPFRKRRARRIFRELVAAVRARHRKLSMASASATEPPVPREQDINPSPPDSPEPPVK